MVKKVSKIIVEGYSVIDDRNAANFFATIDLDNNYDITLSSRQIDKILCKDRREDVRADEAEFEDYVYSIHDKILATDENK